MTNSQIIKAAVEMAMKGGWKRFGIYESKDKDWIRCLILKDLVLFEFCTKTGKIIFFGINDMLFDMSFRKAVTPDRWFANLQDCAVAEDRIRFLQETLHIYKSDDTN